jgi:L-arabinose isomerase
MILKKLQYTWIVDLGNRFRLIVNTVEVVDVPEMPKLPVARVLWIPQPDLEIAANSWILAGGAHHTAFSQSLTIEHLQDFAEIAGIEMQPIIIVRGCKFNIGKGNT